MENATSGVGCSWRARHGLTVVLVASIVAGLATIAYGMGWPPISLAIYAVSVVGMLGTAMFVGLTLAVMPQKLRKPGPSWWARDRAGAIGLAVVVLANTAIALLTLTFGVGMYLPVSVIAYVLLFVGAGLVALPGLPLGVISILTGPRKLVGVLVLVLALTPYPLFRTVIEVTEALGGVFPGR